MMDRLWTGLGKKAASNNLRRALHAARRALDTEMGQRVELTRQH
jgi:DNA-binding SARP family transcriptional activator